MKKKKLLLEGGQVLVLVAVLLMGLFAMAALLLDGGNAYLQRRAAQNAADSGALAGADVYCGGGTVTSATTRATEYVNRNDAVLNGPVTIVDDIVTVPTSITFDTFFAHLIGRPQITVEAVAKAGCFMPAGAVALPIAWACNPPSEGAPQDWESEDCEILYGDEYRYIIMDSDDLEEDFYCSDDPQNPGGTLDCDMDNDGINDVDILSGGDRSWLSFTGEMGASFLSDWIRYGSPVAINIHTWLPAVSGVDTSIFQTVTNYRMGQDVIIPVYDRWCEGDPATNCSTEYHDGTPPPADDEQADTTIAPGSPSNVYYHIISFAIFHITCTRDPNEEPTPGSCIGFNNLGLSPPESTSTKIIEGYFVEGQVPGISAGPGTGVDTGVYTVRLIQ